MIKLTDKIFLDNDTYNLIVKVKRENKDKDKKPKKEGYRSLYVTRDNYIAWLELARVTFLNEELNMQDDNNKLAYNNLVEFMEELNKLDKKWKDIYEKHYKEIKKEYLTNKKE